MAGKSMLERRNKEATLQVGKSAILLSYYLFERSKIISQEGKVTFCPTILKKGTIFRKGTRELAIKDYPKRISKDFKNRLRLLMPNGKEGP